MVSTRLMMSRPASSNHRSTSGRANISVDARRITSRRARKSSLLEHPVKVMKPHELRINAIIMSPCYKLMICYIASKSSYLDLRVVTTTMMVTPPHLVRPHGFGGTAPDLPAPASLPLHRCPPWPHQPPAVAQSPTFPVMPHPGPLS